MENEERELLILQIFLELLKLIMDGTEEATDEKIIKKRQEINEAMKRWNE